GPLCSPALVHVHGPVQRRYGIAPVPQELQKHLLGGHELREDQDLQLGIVLLALELVDEIQERARLRVRTTELTAPGRGEEQLDFGSFVSEALEARLEHGFELLVALQRCPIQADVLSEEGELALG